MLAAVMVVGLAMVLGEHGVVGAGRAAGLAISPLSQWLTDPGVTRVVAAVVDVDTTLGRRRGFGAGTGIVVDPSGVVLTNNHVVEGATAISGIDIGNGRTYPAAVLGRDRRHDIALLQLQGATQLVTVPLGDSSQVTVGDRVVAIGNAGGKDGPPSRASGTVTALGQTVSAADDLTGRREKLTGLIQIAAPLRPGDSGGPLVNSLGQAIGIDTAGNTGYRMGRGSGQGFAIPIDQALQIARRWYSIGN
jgi:S1-C subfamily serine protease